MDKALSYRRFGAFAAKAGPELYAKIFSGIEADAPARAVTAADVLEHTSDAERLKQVAAIVKRDYNANRLIYGLLAARLSAKLPDASLRKLAQPYAALLKGGDRMNAAALFDARNRCAQRYIFYNDGDGVESFESFRARYAGDAAWRIEDNGDYVASTAAGGRGGASRSSRTCHWT